MGLKETVFDTHYLTALKNSQMKKFSSLLFALGFLASASFGQATKTPKKVTTTTVTKPAPKQVTTTTTTVAKPAPKVTTTTTVTKPAPKVTTTTVVAKPAPQATTTTTTVTKKDGTPDNRYKANKMVHSKTVVLKKDGTPDKRYKAGKKA